MYNHAPEGYICPFCLIIQGIENEHVYSVQNDIVYRDQTVTAFISSHQWPNNHGNVIVVPNKHFENIYDLPVHYAVDIHRVAKMIAIAMKVVYSCDGVSTRQHNEPSGNQDVWHYHLHVTPRYRDDRFYTTHRELMPTEKRAKHAKRLRDHLAKQSENTRSLQNQDRETMIEIDHELPTADEYNALRGSVGWNSYDSTAATDGLANSLYMVSVREEGKIIAFGRVVGDGAITFYIQDVIVVPQKRGRGHARRVIEHLMQYIRSVAAPGSVVGLMSARGVEGLYEKF